MVVYTFAPAVKSFFANYGAELPGKTILPFVTNGGRIGHTVKDIENTCQRANVGKAIDIKFDGNNMCLSEKNIRKYSEPLSKNRHGIADNSKTDSFKSRKAVLNCSADKDIFFM